jgi:hypothetical protein
MMVEVYALLPQHPKVPVPRLVPLDELVHGVDTFVSLQSRKMRLQIVESLKKSH